MKMDNKVATSLSFAAHECAERTRNSQVSFMKTSFTEWRIGIIIMLPKYIT